MNNQIKPLFNMVINISSLKDFRNINTIKDMRYVSSSYRNIKIVYDYSRSS